MHLFTLIFGYVCVTNSNQQGGRQQGSDINKCVKIFYLWRVILSLVLRVWMGGLEFSNQ